MNKRRIYGVVITLLVVCSIALFAAESFLAPPAAKQTELDFTLTDKNDCLRFLNPEVKTAYIPFHTGANEQWQLTINATEMPGGANGWTDVTSTTVTGTAA